MTLPSGGALFGAILFGSIGMGAFMYGKRGTLVPPMVLGIALMVFPYFVSNTWAIYAVGVLLCAGLWLWR
ncbi:MAG: hypothetical protein GC151_19955 [Betaproteobacteria bacterium]|nr:hypothetical protein [Betaproteobacteria bacterium]